MTTEHAKAALQRYIKLTLPAVEALPQKERADAYEGIAAACENIDPEMQRRAADVAHVLREAESAQLLFRSLLS